MLILEREKTEHKRGRGKEGGRQTMQSRLQSLSCQHRAWCWAWTHGPWDDDLSQSWTLNWLSHPEAPECLSVSGREREWEQGKGRERDRQRQRERDRERTPNRLCTVSTEPDLGLHLRNHEIMTWPKVGRLTDWATQAPHKQYWF